MIFGNAKASFTPEWRKQGFSFCDLYGLEYGIVHLKVSLCLFQLVSLSQLSDFPANKRLVTVSKIFDRAVFKSLSKVVTPLRFLTLVIGLKISCQYFNQREEKPKLIAACKHDIYHALSKLQVIGRNSDWRIAGAVCSCSDWSE